VQRGDGDDDARVDTYVYCGRRREGMRNATRDWRLSLGNMRFSERMADSSVPYLSARPGIVSESTIRCSTSTTAPSGVMSGYELACCAARTLCTLPYLRKCDRMFCSRRAVTAACVMFGSQKLDTRSGWRSSSCLAANLQRDYRRERVSG